MADSFVSDIDSKLDTLADIKQLPVFKRAIQIVRSRAFGITKVPNQGSKAAGCSCLPADIPVVDTSRAVQAACNGVRFQPY